MATYSVRPLPDGVDQRLSWQVTGPGGRISSHTRKSAARSRARQAASDGDQLEIYGTDGVLQTSVTVRDASAGDGDGRRNAGDPFAVAWAEERLDIGLPFDEE